MVGLCAWSPAAVACGGSSGIWALGMLAYPLLVIFLLSLIALLSMRGASQAFGRMRKARPGGAMRAAHIGTGVFYVGSIITTVVSGGLMLALGLLALA
ncbi:MAG: hypothetical protein K0V04_33955 [Deltaproteobacteria bacterium]|nr:hypothetical protein [Deltaproteobacteria bacterium]